MHNCLRTIGSALLLFLLVACGTSPGVARYERAAEAAALEWLELLDMGLYGETWETAATMFRASIAKEQWEARARTVQGQLGTPMSRELIAIKYTDRPLAQLAVRQGERVVAQYRTSFGARRIIETLAMERNGDRWLTATYLISFQ
jgi:hypothetical protein